MLGLIVGLAASQVGQAQWTPLFNGKDLSGWVPKFAGQAAGVNWGETFRVEDGLLKVRYDRYPDGFSGRFGHLFTVRTFSRYRLRVVYRFVGEQCSGGAGWAWRNSGAMLHCQSPWSMALDQEFPVSVEAQFLGGDGTNERTTGNLCTPGTNVVLGGKLDLRHCIGSSSKTVHGDAWTTFEATVDGAGTIVHSVDGVEVLRYSQPQLDERDADAQRLLKLGPKLLDSGHIALQAESHPLDVKSVEVAPL